MALSYADKANIENGAATGTAVSLQETINACIRDVGGQILKGGLTLAGLPYCAANGVTQNGLNETALRMSRGGLTQEIIPHVLADAAITNGAPSDASILAAVQYAIWPIAVLITNGKA